MKMFQAGKWVLMIGLVFILTACGGGGATDTTGTDTTIITGVASKGPIKNGTVKVYAITNGAKGTTPIGTTTTSDSGNYSVNIGAYTGAVIVEVTGGTYTDEATATTKDNPGLRVAISNVQENQTAAITPLTEIAVQKAIAVGGFTQVNIDAANTVVSNMMGGINIVTTLPIDVKSATAAATSIDAQKQYSLMLAAISKIDATNGSVTVSDVIADIVADLSDGMLDDGAGSSISSALAAVTSDSSINQTGLTIGTMTIDESIQTATTTTISSVSNGTGSVTNPPSGQFGVKIYKPTDECNPDTVSSITGLDGNPVPITVSGGVAGTVTPYYFDEATNSVYAGLSNDVSGWGVDVYLGLASSGSDSGGPYVYKLFFEDGYRVNRIDWEVYPRVGSNGSGSYPTHCIRSGSAQIDYDGQLKNIVIEWDGTNNPTDSDPVSTGGTLTLSAPFASLSSQAYVYDQVSSNIIWRVGTREAPVAAAQMRIDDNPGFAGELFSFFVYEGYGFSGSWVDVGENYQDYCVLSGTDPYNNYPPCSSWGITVDRSAGTISFASTPVSDSAGTTGTMSGSLTFTPLGPDTGNPTTTYSISGTVKDSSNAGISAVTIALSGSATQTTNTDSSGNYTFAGLTNGTYTLTPSKTGYTFNPASQSVTVSNANVTGKNFSLSTATGYSTVPPAASIISALVGTQISATSSIYRHKGEMQKTNFSFKGCNIDSVNITYDLDSYFGEPTVKSNIKWTGSPSTCLPGTLSGVSAKLDNGVSTTYVDLSIGSVNNSGQGYGYNSTASPMWWDMYCGNGANSNVCWDEATAKAFFKSNYTVKDFVLW